MAAILLTTILHVFVSVGTIDVIWFAFQPQHITWTNDDLVFRPKYVTKPQSGYCNFVNEIIKKNTPAICCYAVTLP